MAAMREGMRLGAAADKLSHLDIAALMHEPLADARTRLNIGDPATYRECLRILRGEGLRAEDVMPGGKLAA